VDCSLALESRRLKGFVLRGFVATWPGSLNKHERPPPRQREYLLIGRPKFNLCILVYFSRRLPVAASSPSSDDLELDFVGCWAILATRGSRLSSC
jgi:hypothetical protein